MKLQFAATSSGLCHLPLLLFNPTNVLILLQNFIQVSRRKLRIVQLCTKKPQKVPTVLLKFTSRLTIGACRLPLVHCHLVASNENIYLGALALYRHTSRASLRYCTYDGYSLPEKYSNLTILQLKSLFFHQASASAACKLDNMCYYSKLDNMCYYPRHGVRTSRD